MPQDAGHAFCRCAMTALLSLHSMFKAQYKCQVIIIIIITMTLNFYKTEKNC